MSVSVVNTKSVLPNLAQSLLKVPINALNKDDASKSISEASAVDEKPKPFDPRLYRPLEVIVSFTIHDVQAHIVKVMRSNFVLSIEKNLNFISFFRVVMITIHRVQLF